MAHIFGVILCVFTLWLARPGSSLFSWHPTLMTIGFGGFMLEAILVFSPYSSLILTQDRKTKAMVHWVLQLLALVSVLLGLAAIVYNKFTNDKSHFTSWHSWFGIVAVTMTAMQCLAGINMYYSKSTLTNPLQWKLASLKKIHALYGTVVFLIACCALVTSLYSNWFNKVGGELAFYTMLFSITILTSVVVNQTYNEHLKPKSDK